MRSNGVKTWSQMRLRFFSVPPCCHGRGTPPPLMNIVIRPFQKSWIRPWYPSFQRSADSTIYHKCAYCHSYHILGKQYSISINSFSYILLTPLPCMIPSPQTMHVMLNMSNNCNVSFIFFYNFEEWKDMCTLLPKIPCMHTTPNIYTCLRVHRKQSSLQRYIWFV